MERLFSEFYGMSLILENTLAAYANSAKNQCITKEFVNSAVFFWLQAGGRQIKVKINKFLKVARR